MAGIGKGSLERRSQLRAAGADQYRSGGHRVSKTDDGTGRVYGHRCPHRLRRAILGTTPPAVGGRGSCPV